MNTNTRYVIQFDGATDAMHVASYAGADLDTRMVQSSRLGDRIVTVWDCAAADAEALEERLDDDAAVLEYRTEAR